MDYALQTLERESSLIAKTLSTWMEGKHPEAKKEREKRLKELNKAIKAINLHDELVEFLKELEFNYRGTDTAVRAYELIKKAKE